MSRTAIVIIILALCVIDLMATFYYVHTYKDWQPNKPYNLIELNPLLVFLWNKMGLILGGLVGAVALLTLNYIIAKEAHWIIVVILFLVLSFAMYNHFSNINLLHALIEKYPSGSLPVEVFGKVVGSN